VEVLPPVPPVAATGLHVVVRTGGELTAELTGLDAPIAVAVLEALLRARAPLSGWRAAGRFTWPPE
jgi:hypothetical protein